MPYTNRYAQAFPQLCHAQQATPLSDPRLVIASESAAKLVDLSLPELEQAPWQQVLVGQATIDGMQPVATVYAGHQFGGYSPQLGDGRALMLGEYRNQQGEHWELQLKGSGLTPFSRHGDGKAVLRSTIREFLASEAMAALGIPTTRALGMTMGSGVVQRERPEPEAMLLRMAPSHIRFGHFEYLFHQQRKDDLRALVDFCLEHYFPEQANAEDPVLAMLEEVTIRTADMIAHWLAVGFCHGVMNTDNMSLLGLTIDYGPYGFLDDYDPRHICNHSDSYDRYAFDQQAGVGLWNLQCLAYALSDLVSSEQCDALWERYKTHINARYLWHWQRKLGLSQWQANDEALLGGLLELLQTERLDLTVSLRQLSEGEPTLLTQSSAGKRWLGEYRARLADDDQTEQQRLASQQQHNPCYILRNYLAQQAIDHAEQGDFQTVRQLHKVLNTPYQQQAGCEEYAQAAPDWGKHLEISCSS